MATDDPTDDPTGESAADDGVSATLARELANANAETVDPGHAAALAVGQAVRDVIERFTATSAPEEVLLEAAARMAGIVDLLGDYRPQRSYEGLAEASGLGHTRAHFDWSPVLGQANPLAPPVQAVIEGDIVVGRAVFGSAYEGPPGCVHGGYVAAAFDEILGLTQSLSGQTGMTGTLTVRYRRPTPLHTELRFEGRLDGHSGRKVQTSGVVIAGGEVTAEASGLFITVSPARFAALDRARAQRWGESAAGGPP